MSVAEIESEREAASRALQDAVERMARAYAREPSVVSDYVVLVNTTWFTSDGETAEGFSLYWPHDRRTGYTAALGLFDRGHRYVYKCLDEPADD